MKTALLLLLLATPALAQNDDWFRRQEAERQRQEIEQLRRQQAETQRQLEAERRRLNAEIIRQQERRRETLGGPPANFGRVGR